MLIRFHVLLIASGILFSFAFSVYELFRAGREAPAANAAVAVAFLAAGCGLAMYLRGVIRRGIRG